MKTKDNWPVWQYGNYITWPGRIDAAGIKECKALCRMQAKETFAALQVPDASDKIEYVVCRNVPRGDGSGALDSTVGWKVSIPAPAWQVVISEHPDKERYLKQVLKTRKRRIPIALNGVTQMIPRRVVLYYLKAAA